AKACGDEAEPDDEGRHRVLSRDEAQAPVPAGSPEGERGREGTAPEQPGGVAPPVARTVVPGDDQPEDECEGVLPTIEVPRGEELLHRVTDPRAEQRSFPDGPIQLAQD